MKNKRVFWIGISFLLVGFLIMIQSFNINYPRPLFEDSWRIYSNSISHLQYYVKSIAVLLIGFILSLGGMCLLVKSITNEE
ncbi:hypothetical protein ACFWM3_18670 [Gottfriedia sp. NPDC058432]|uniref:hypothetical protein n=1 Tax=Gottfriedia sp. NPDC058432 TaxID=3346497 RepID=UPI003667F9CE